MSMVTLGSTGICVNKNGFGALPVQRVTKEDAVYLLRLSLIHICEFTWKDLFTGEKRVLRGVPVPARGYAWYYRKWN